MLTVLRNYNQQHANTLYVDLEKITAIEQREHHTIIYLENVTFGVEETAEQIIDFKRVIKENS